MTNAPVHTPPTSESASIRLTADEQFLRQAARLALRGHGSAEPNPLVGCVIVNDRGEVVGSGYHRRYGGPHAEIIAIENAGPRARGATAYVTLEPCNHQGKTGPCTSALIEAGLHRVVIGRLDPNPDAQGGAALLRERGVEVVVLDHLPEVRMVSEPFVHRITTGMPWIIAKWAQTIDGRIATRARESQWISSQRSRRLVHRERGRVDAIMTGVGTVVADDPLLTARNVRCRRVARRVVIDPNLQTPMTSKLVATTAKAPTLIACQSTLIEQSDHRVDALRERGVDVFGLPIDENGVMPLQPLLQHLVSKHDVTNVLVEAGAAMLGQMFAQQLVNEAWVFIAPLLLGDEHALTAVRGLTIPRLADAASLQLVDHRLRGPDVMLRYRVNR